MKMIVLKKLNGKDIVINAEIIETIEAAPDTVITLVTGNRYIVKDSTEEVRAKVIEFKREIWRDSGRVTQDWMRMEKEKRP
ncbi:MAG: flagellar FlbD family protein [Elusimicrobiota bacterium]